MKVEDFKEGLKGYPKVMLCWDYDEDKAKECLVLYKSLRGDITYPYICILKNGIDENFRNAKPLPEEKKVKKTLDNLEIGDRLVSNIGNIFTVEGVIGRVYILIREEDGTTLFYSVKELKDYNYRLSEENDTDVTYELTIEDVAKLKGVSVDKIRIKD